MNPLKTFITATLLITSSASLSQSQNSQEHHRQFNPQHPGYDGNSHSQPQRRPSEVWQNYYGAIAADWSAGKGGFAENQTSARRARQVALQQCGTKNCKIVASTTNGCLATAHGGGGTGVGAGDTADSAVQDTMNICQKDGSTCEPRYLHCNHPVRIR